MNRSNFALLMRPGRADRIRILAGIKLPIDVKKSIIDRPDNSGVITRGRGASKEGLKGLSWVKRGNGLLDFRSEACNLCPN